MIVALRQGSERAGLFLYMPEEHPPQGAASGEQQQRWQPAISRLLHDAVLRRQAAATVPLPELAFSPCATACGAACRAGVMRAEMRMRICGRCTETAYLSCRRNVLYVHVPCFSQMCGARQCERK